MAIVCDICNKGARSKGPGAQMFVVEWAYESGGGISIHLETVEESHLYFRRNATVHAVCGACLTKLGVPEMMAESAKLDKERDVDVTPKQIGAPRTRLIGDGR